MPFCSDGHRCDSLLSDRCFAWHVSPNRGFVHVKDALFVQIPILSLLLAECHKVCYLRDDISGQALSCSCFSTKNQVEAFHKISEPSTTSPKVWNSCLCKIFSPLLDKFAWHMMLQFSHPHDPFHYLIFNVIVLRFAPTSRQCLTWVAVNGPNFSGRKDRGRTFWSNCRDRMECGRFLSYLLYGSVASLPSPSSNIEAWPYGTSLRFAPAFRALGVCEHIWLRYKNFDPSCFDPIQNFGMSTWGLTLIFELVPSTYVLPPFLLDLPAFFRSSFWLLNFRIMHSETPKALSAARFDVFSACSMTFSLNCASYDFLAGISSQQLP